MTIRDLITRLELSPHPEGGYYRESWRTDAEVTAAGFDGPRAAMTDIFYLLPQGEKSAFHRIKSDEIWHFHLGGGLEIIEIDDAGRLSLTRLGPDIQSGDHLQHVVPAGRWFAARPAAGSDYALVSCVVAPGFDFREFEMADGTALARKWPEHSGLIGELT